MSDPTPDERVINVVIYPPGGRPEDGMVQAVSPEEYEALTGRRAPHDVTAPAPERSAAVVLHARVLAALAVYDDTAHGHWGVGAVRIKTWSQVLRRIAKRHAPTKTAWLGEDVDNCTECGQGYWPCGTFRDVAAAAGVEVPDA